ncbi:hypothetical protein CDL15_Pgr023669 [Punica granatum]|uniref:Uncharacterized protein n=1 Tax=Punica granatum TaxID=22663 RepID=A0A218XXC6_PUNGR|nr:hypothetical protein CDL15_Pgr023669 [Punica granatum]PKI60428.1 hypothetical protein CRG98_019169 [Punica granatum]
MAATNPIGASLTQLGHPERSSEFKPFRSVFTVGHGGSGQPRDPSRWWWWSLGSKGLGLTRIALQSWTKHRNIQKTDPTGKSRVNGATVASDGFWQQGRWATMAKGPLEVTVVVA